jgi:hypothetical protein
VLTEASYQRGEGRGLLTEASYQREEGRAPAGAGPPEHARRRGEIRQRGGITRDREEQR